MVSQRSRHGPGETRSRRQIRNWPIGFSHRAAARRHAEDHLYQIARRHAADHLYQIMGSVANLPLPDDCTLMRVLWKAVYSRICLFHLVGMDLRLRLLHAYKKLNDWTKTGKLIKKHLIITAVSRFNTAKPSKCPTRNPFTGLVLSFMVSIERLKTYIHAKFHQGSRLLSFVGVFKIYIYLSVDSIVSVCGSWHVCTSYNLFRGFVYLSIIYFAFFMVINLSCES